MSGRGSAASVVARSVGGDPAERRRRRLLAVASAGCVAFALAAVAVATVTDPQVHDPGCVTYDDGTLVCYGADGAVSISNESGIPAGFPSAEDLMGSSGGLAPFVAQEGLRVGVVVAAVLLVVPFAVFAVQVLRLGSAARERRLAALRLQGATSADLRRIATAEARPAALAGAVLGIPVYLVLWVLLGLVPPSGLRMLPLPDPVLLIAWPVLAGLFTAGTALAARRTAAVATADALGGPRRRARGMSVAARVAPVLLVVALVVVIVAFAVDRASSSSLRGIAFVAVIPALLVAVAVATGPWLVILAGSLAVRSRDTVRVLAGRRLLADPRTPGRPAGVLLAVGLAVGMAASGLAGSLIVAAREGVDDLGFYVSGYLLALGGIAVAAVVAAASLVTGAGEQVLDTRRPTAALVALGAEPSAVRRILRFQLVAAAVVPAVVGALAGVGLLGGLLTVVGGSSRGDVLVALLLTAVLAVLLSGGAASAGAAAAGRLLRRPLAEAMAVDNLRTA